MDTVKDKYYSLKRKFCSVDLKCGAAKINGLRLVFSNSNLSSNTYFINICINLIKFLIEYSKYMSQKGVKKFNQKIYVLKAYFLNITLSTTMLLIILRALGTLL